jgi:hypothetical protein
VRQPAVNRSRIVSVLAVVSCLAGRPASAQDPTVELVVPSGRPLRVALAESTTVRRVGQTVTATVVEPVYSYDRIVLPVGTPVQGRITKLESPSQTSRFRSMSAGDFSPHYVVQIRFESAIQNGEPMTIDTIAKNQTTHMKRQVARDVDEEGTGAVAHVKAEATAEVSETVAAVKHKASDAALAVTAPGRMARLKEWAINRLPYHPQVLHQGTVYDAELQAPLTFGKAPLHVPAPQGTLPAPDSILAARLVTTLDSGTTPRGAPLEAVVSQPVFAEDGRLILPEGTRLTGEVTFAQSARRFHRNGQLRFLFERVELPDQESAPLIASLHAIDVSGDDRIVLDDEGGAAVQNSKTRFVAPALALLALRASLDQGEGRGFERAPTGARVTAASGGSGNYLARGVGGVFGFGALGAALSVISRPLGIAFGVVGATRSVYTNVLGKGQELRFQADTPIQVHLAPGRSVEP